MGKAGTRKSQIDFTKRHGIDDKILYGLDRRKEGGVHSIGPSAGGINSGGGSSGAGGGGSSGSSSNGTVGVLVKQITPQTHVSDTTDGVAVGWCPNGARTQFIISDTDVGSKSVVTANVSSVNGTDNYADRTAVKVQLINYIDLGFSGFLILCESAPVSTDNLNYAIFNTAISKVITSNNPGAVGGGFYDDGGVCGTLISGVVRAMKINKSQGLQKDDIIVSVGVKACNSGGHARLKILGDLVACGVDPFSRPGGVIAETDSFPLVSGWNDVNINVTVPHDPYYSGVSGCGANDPNAGAVWIGVEVDANKDLGYFAVNPFFGYTYQRVHTYGTGAPSYNYPTDIQSDAFNVRLSWVKVIQ